MRSLESHFKCEQNRSRWYSELRQYRGLLILPRCMQSAMTECLCLQRPVSWLRSAG